MKINLDELRLDSECQAAIRTFVTSRPFDKIQIAILKGVSTGESQSDARLTSDFLILSHGAQLGLLALFSELELVAKYKKPEPEKKIRTGQPDPDLAT